MVMFLLDIFEDKTSLTCEFIFKKNAAITMNNVTMRSIKKIGHHSHDGRL